MTKKPLKKKLYEDYEKRFPGTPRALDRLLFSMKGLPGFLKGIIRFPRNLLLSLARSGLLASRNVTRIYRLCGVKVGKGGSIASVGAYFDVMGLKYITIGDNVNISPNVVLMTHAQTPRYLAPYYGMARLKPLERWKPKPITIEDGAVLYTGCIILPGITVGEGALVGAGALVNRDVPPFTVVGGIPAKVIKSIRAPLYETVEHDGVEILPYRHGRGGALVLSADFELDWGHGPETRNHVYGRNGRRYFPGLMRFLEDHQVPVTWATVGHLFLESCGEGGNAHQDMPEPEENWYSQDPCSGVQDAPGRYAPDLIKRIQESPLPHEFGCHSFSHIDMSDENCPSPFARKSCSHDLALAEMKRCQELAREVGVTLRSHVFPKDYAGNFAALADAGLIAFRGRNTDQLLKAPVKEHGLWNIPGTIFLESIFLMRAKEDILFRAGRYLEEAWRVGGCVHLSFHPWMMSPKVLKLLEPVFETIQRLEKEEKLWLTTMGELASYCEARGNTHIQKTEEEGRIVLKILKRFDHERYGYPELTLVVPLPEGRKVEAVTPEEGTIIVQTRESDGVNHVILTIQTKLDSVTLQLG